MANKSFGKLSSSKKKEDDVPDFDAWLVKSANYQARFLTGTEDADAAIEMLQTKVGFVGLVEQFNESLVLLKSWSDQRQLKIRYRSRNIAEDNQIKRQILDDAKQCQAVIDHNQEDIKLYRYVCEEIYPRQLADYGPRLQTDVSRLEASLPAPRQVSLSIALSNAHRWFLYKPGDWLRRNSKPRKKAA
ncbi:MAG: hypothetical protein QGF59_03830 [Pirellulaceae bacterium]|nr:hypothetical protein [Pirellulaceae bacterium]